MAPLPHVLQRRTAGRRFNPAAFGTILVDAS